MAVYRFKISFEDYDEIVRVMEFKASQTFEDVKIAFHNLIGFDTDKVSSFYMSDDNWKKGKEITNRILTDEESASVKSLNESRLSDFIIDPHQKIYYVYDTDAQWSFHIELVKITSPENGAIYPRCIKTAGEAPKQYGSTVLGAVPEPEDYDEDAIAMLEEEELINDGEVSDEIESPLDEGDELEPANEDMIDDETPEGDEFN
jgi:hypothetical protein